MSIRLVKAQLHDLTPELCEHFSTMPELKGERDLNERHVEFLNHHLIAGTFYSPRWAVAIVKDTVERLRADGHHSSTLLTRVAKSAPERFPEGLSALVVDYEIDSIETDAGDLFNLFDNPKSTRTNTDAMSIFRAHYDEFKGFANSFLVSVAKGINFYLGDLAKAIKKEHEKVAAKAVKKGLKVPKCPALPLRHEPRQYGLYWIEPKYREFAVWVRQWNDARCAWIIQKTGALAQAFDSWLSAPENAELFWGFVFREDHPDPDHPSRKLVLKLRALSAKPRHTADDYKNCAEESWATYLLKTRSEPDVEPEPEPEFEPEPIAEAAASVDPMPLFPSPEVPAIGPGLGI